MFYIFIPTLAPSTPLLLSIPKDPKGGRCRAPHPSDSASFGVVFVPPLSFVLLLCSCRGLDAAHIAVATSRHQVVWQITSAVRCVSVDDSQRRMTWRRMITRITSRDVEDLFPDIPQMF